MKYEYTGDKIKININGGVRLLRQGDTIECDENDIQGNPNFKKIEDNKINKKSGGK